MSVNKLWHNGPPWLANGGIEEGSELHSMPEECHTEMKAKNRKLHHTLLAQEDTKGLGQIMKCEDHSSLRQLLAVTSHVLKFVSALRHKASSESSEPLENLD